MENTEPKVRPLFTTGPKSGSGRKTEVKSGRRRADSAAEWRLFLASLWGQGPRAGRVVHLLMTGAVRSIAEARQAL